LEVVVDGQDSGLENSLLDQFQPQQIFNPSNLRVFLEREASPETPSQPTSRSGEVLTNLIIRNGTRMFALYDGLLKYNKIYCIFYT
jgi:hypothetical protein